MINLACDEPKNERGEEINFFTFKCGSTFLFLK